MENRSVVAVCLSVITADAKDKIEGCEIQSNFKWKRLKKSFDATTGNETRTGFNPTSGGGSESVGSSQDKKSTIGGGKLG